MLINTPISGTEAPRAGDFISSEAPGTFSRGQEFLAAANDGATSYVAGTVLGQSNIGSVAAFGAPASGGATCSAITVSAGAVEGVYEIVFYANSAVSAFDVFAPGGALIAKGAVGSAFSAEGLAFTLSDASGHVAIDEVATITVGTAAFAVTGGDTGNPTCGAITVDPGITPGVYTFTMTDATHFTGVDAVGNVLPAGVFGTAYHAGGLDFTVSAGGTPCVAGDSFTITTHIGSGNFGPVNSAGADGTQNAAGVLFFQTYVGGAAPVKVAVIKRNAEVKKDLLAWPTGATDDQIRNWTAQLKALGIIARDDLV